MHQRSTVFICSVFLLAGIVMMSEAGLGLGPLDFFLAFPEHSKAIPIAFRPDDGLKYRENFERKHGKRGERLIESLGRGIKLQTGNTLEKPDANKNQIDLGKVKNKV